jgi:hypothetical protein
MRFCLNCSFENREGVMFCERCGVALGAISVGTKQLGEDEDYFSAGSEYLSEEHVILLHFAGYDDPIAVQLDDQLILGRSVETGTIFNLERFNALDQGVSRQHALLTREDNQVFIRDLGSTNHTFLNGNQLMEARDYALRDGDEVILGRLNFKVFFQ